MRLSEAIRLGAMLNMQGFGAMFVPAPDGTTATCALGAAATAGYNVGQLREDRVVKCPVCQTNQPLSAWGVIAELNDWHRWTREQIADFVATVEDQLICDAVGTAHEPTAGDPMRV